MKRLRTLIPLLTLMVMLLTGCEHKELCLHHPHISRLRVEFDWMDAPDANPDGMCVWFYPILEGDDDLRRPERFDFKGRSGGEIDLPVGRYQVITYNNDTEAQTFFSTDSYTDHRVFTRVGNLFEVVAGNGAAAPRASGAEAERVVICPDQMWGVTAEVEITDTEVIYITAPELLRGESVPVESADRVVMLYPHDLMCHYTYEIRNVENLERVSQMSASLSGMAPMLWFAGERLSDEPVTLPFEAHADGSTTIRGEFLTWGHHEEVTAPHRMMLYVWMDNGQKFSFGATEERFDVTSQVHTAPDRRHVHIIIDGLGIPTPISGEDGMEPSVDDWIEVNEDINI